MQEHPIDTACALGPSEFDQLWKEVAQNIIQLAALIRVQEATVRKQEKALYGPCLL
jgi:hypothetical protein